MDTFSIAERQAALAAMLANPSIKRPSLTVLADSFGCTIRTIERDMDSPAVAAAVADLVRTHARAMGLGQAYRILWQAMIGAKGYTKRDGLSAARFLISMGRMLEDNSEPDLFPPIDGPPSRVPHVYDQEETT